MATMVWCKWIGIILLAAAAACIGFWMAYRMEKQLDEYRQLQKVFMLLMSRMRIGEPLEMAMESCIQAGAGAWEPWLRRVSDRLAKREALSAIWPEELKQLKKELHLESEDYRVLEGLGKSLQGARLENCLGQLSQVQDYFHSQQAVLEQAILEQSRMYKTIGILAGILVMVVLA